MVCGENNCFDCPAFDVCRQKITEVFGVYSDVDKLIRKRIDTWIRKRIDTWIRKRIDT